MNNILFVCYGNMCRSPIAEGLAKNLLDEKSHVESAGISPSKYRATDEAIEVMRNEFATDISGHRPRAVSDIELGRFDTIVALDSYVYNHLREFYRIDADRLVLWEIEDPYGSGIDAFRECAFHIQRCVEALCRE